MSAKAEKQVRTPEDEAASQFKYFLETVVACGPHPSEDHDVVVFESGLYVEGGAYVNPGDKVIWVVEGEENDERTVGVFRAEVDGDKIVIHQSGRINPLLIHTTDERRRKREAQISTVPAVINSTEVVIPERDMEKAEKVIAQMPLPKRL